MAKNNSISEQFRCLQGASEVTIVRTLHSLLKNKNLDEKVVEESCNFIMSLFPKLTDQMLFEKHYRNYLTLRVVEKSSISKDLELRLIEATRSLVTVSRPSINLLGKERGDEFIADMKMLFQEGMFESPDIVKRYKNHHFEKGLPYTYTFDITLLPYIACPWWTYARDEREFRIPPELIPAFQSFAEFFAGDIKNRVLHWLHSRGKGKLATSGTFLKNPKEYVFNCSLYQMTILLMFNKKDSRPFQEIMAQSGLSDIEASKVVLQLVKADLLLVEKKGDSSSPDILAKEDLVKLNLDFHSSNSKIQIDTAVRVEQQKKDDDRAAEDTMRTKKIMLQTAIIRVMKANKRITHNGLVAEVVADNLKPGKPIIHCPLPYIKKGIEELINTEFMERDKDDQDIYIYTA